MNLISKYLQDTKIQTGLGERFLKSGVNMNMDVFQSNVLELMRSTPDLSKATPKSVVAACLAATMMGLKFDKTKVRPMLYPIITKRPIVQSPSFKSVGVAIKALLFKAVSINALA